MPRPLVVCRYLCSMCNAVHLTRLIVPHHVIWIVDQVCASRPSDKRVFYTIPKFLPIVGRSPVASVTAAMGCIPIPCKSVRQKCISLLTWQRNPDETVWEGFSTLERCLNLPIHISPAMCARAYQHERDACIADVITANNRHNIIGICAADEIVINTCS